MKVFHKRFSLPYHSPKMFHKELLCFMKDSWQKANKALHWTAIPLRSIAAGELGRYGDGFDVTTDYTVKHQKEFGHGRHIARI
jgi:hypothetical protein